MELIDAKRILKRFFLKVVNPSLFLELLKVKVLRKGEWLLVSLQELLRL